MQIQVNTDGHIQRSEALAEWVERDVQAKVERFRDSITRVEVHLSDVGNGRNGEADKRCLLEARVAGRAPIGVSHDAAKLADAVHGAAEKLVRTLDNTLGRARDAHGRETIRGQ